MLRFSGLGGSICKANSLTITDRDNYSSVLKEGESHISFLGFMCVHESNLPIHSVSLWTGREEDCQETPGWDKKQTSIMASWLFLVVMMHEFAVGSQGDR